MTQKKRLATLALCALSVAPFSALANPIPLNGSFSFNGSGVASFSPNGGGIDTATSVVLENPIEVSQVNTTTFGNPNYFDGILKSGFFGGTLGYIGNSLPNGTFPLTIGNNSTPISNLLGITAPNGDTFNFSASSESVLNRNSSGGASSMSVIFLGTMVDTGNNISPTLSSLGLTFIDNAGTLGYTGAFSAPPATINVPEPGSLLLVGIGALGLGLCARKFKVTGRVSSGLQGTISKWGIQLSAVMLELCNGIKNSASSIRRAPRRGRLPTQLRRI
ncbi:PEP-CTERM sorting domain-containing protein [Ferrovum myxofaciens]|uniref:PEP-CTERM sorting domain-containing protein n=1 Tax=Ferrovum myxofaciens TaxID=416213 RepID=UPI0023528D35|nr:PEP-CTERM sorting domain-containing protein [Ferrovum myxofaciens]MBU6995445.1 PEP-CTERM sorting domain-containing protein [Ferrovum myxofaciens]